MDLRGYGWSSAPESDLKNDPRHEVYSKRAMAADVVKVMEELGHVRFAAVGHDRGARVAYRLALDHPGRVERLAVLDIMPTLTMWESMDAKRAMQVYHWTFLAQPAPMPERLIGADPIAWQDEKLASWSGTHRWMCSIRARWRTTTPFSTIPSASTRSARITAPGRPSTLRSTRRTAMRARPSSAPRSRIWGASGIPAASSSPLDAWRASFAPKIEGGAVRVRPLRRGGKSRGDTGSADAVPDRVIWKGRTNTVS